MREWPGLDVPIPRRNRGPSNALRNLSFRGKGVGSVWHALELILSQLHSELSDIK